MKFLKKALIGFQKIINFVIPKQNNSIYAIPHKNCDYDKYDISNPNASNLLSFISFLIYNYDLKKLTINLEVFDSERIEQLKCINNNKKIELLFRLSYSNMTGISKVKTAVKNRLKQFQCKHIWVETGGMYYLKNKKQVVVCFNYFISFKDDFHCNIPKAWIDVDYLFTTSKLAAQIVSISNGPSFENIYITGFSRNDNLAKMKDKKELLKNLTNIDLQHKLIILYAPTYKDYDKNSKIKRSILGYESNMDLKLWLKNNNAVIIAKLHPLQNRDVFEKDNNIILYNPSYNYSFYDFLPIADILITDYSSIGYDYLLMDKPIIYNFFDYDLYKKTRGFAYDPITAFTPGAIVSNWLEMKEELNNLIKGNDFYQEKRHYLTEIFHKNNDFDSNTRILEIICQILKL